MSPWRVFSGERRTSFTIGDGEWVEGYHGTTVANALAIVESGFRPSASGMLGPGVYWSDDVGKTRPYVRDASGTVLKLMIGNGKTKTIDQRGHASQLTWHAEGYDSAYVPPNTTPAAGWVQSGLSENCTFDPSRVMVVAVSSDYGVTFPDTAQQYVRRVRGERAIRGAERVALAATTLQHTHYTDAQHYHKNTGLTNSQKQTQFWAWAGGRSLPPDDPTNRAFVRCTEVLPAEELAARLEPSAQVATEKPPLQNHWEWGDGHGNRFGLRAGLDDGRVSLVESNLTEVRGWRWGMTEPQEVAVCLEDEPELLARLLVALQEAVVAQATALAEKTADKGKEAAEKAAADSAPLPDGWTRAALPSGTQYYYHDSAPTKITFERPAEFCTGKCCTQKVVHKKVYTLQPIAPSRVYAKAWPYTQVRVNPKPKHESVPDLTDQDPVAYHRSLDDATLARCSRRAYRERVQMEQQLVSERVVQDMRLLKPTAKQGGMLELLRRMDESGRSDRRDHTWYQRVDSATEKLHVNGVSTSGQRWEDILSKDDQWKLEAQTRKQERRQRHLSRTAAGSSRGRNARDEDLRGVPSKRDHQAVARRQRAARDRDHRRLYRSRCDRRTSSSGRRMVSRPRSNFNTSSKCR